MNLLLAKAAAGCWVLSHKTADGPFWKLTWCLLLSSAIQPSGNQVRKTDMRPIITQVVSYSGFGR